MDFLFYLRKLICRYVILIIMIFVQFLFLLHLSLCAILDLKNRKLKRVFFLIPFLFCFYIIFSNFLNGEGYLFFFNLFGFLLGTFICIIGKKLKFFGTADFPFIISLFVVFGSLPGSFIFAFSVLIPLLFKKNNSKFAYLPYLFLGVCVYALVWLLLTHTSLEFYPEFLYLLL